MLDRPVLILNADYRPLSWFPLSVCRWEDAIKAVYMDRVGVVEDYETIVSSPSMSMAIPAVIVLKQFIAPITRPPFTRRNLFLRDMHHCQYCGRQGRAINADRGVALTLDHVYPKSHGGPRNWANIVSSCAKCNLKKADRTPTEAKMTLYQLPYEPTVKQLWRNSLKLLVSHKIPKEWQTYLIPDEEMHDAEYEFDAAGLFVF
jgi:5-methylcytosine-specific restriction endonuclease McrA